MSHSPSYSPVLDSLENLHENLLEDSDDIINPFYYAQDRQGWYDEVAAKACGQDQKKAEDKIKKKKNKPKTMKNTSFIIKKESGHARHLIKIMIHDFKGHNMDDISTEPNDASVNVQYLVTSDYDDIMEETEHLVCKVMKKLSKSSV